MPTEDRVTRLLVATRPRTEVPGRDVSSSVPAPEPQATRGGGRRLRPDAPGARDGRASAATTRSGRHRQPEGARRPHPGGPPARDARSPVAGPAVDDTQPLTPLPSERLVRARDGVLEVPRGLRGAHLTPPWAAVIGAAVVVAIALTVLLSTVFREEGRATPAATTVRRTAASGTPGAPSDPSSRPSSVTQAPAQPMGAAATGAAVVPAPEATSAPQVTVHVVGEVRRPGVVTLPAGARVTDAVSEAGGPTRKAVLSGLNLARHVVDGEQILVPDSADAPIPIATAPPPMGAPGGAAGPVDLNTADQAMLETLPGVGPVLAGRILEWRAAHGRFSSVDELGEVSGVGEKTLESLRPHVRV